MVSSMFMIVVLFVILGIIYLDYYVSHNKRGFEVVADEHRKYPDVEIQLPTRATDGSAGYDFYSPADVTIKPGESFLIWTDVKAFMALSNVLELYPRSSVAIKKNLKLKNVVGIIDHDFYNNFENNGRIGICLENTGSIDQTVEKGERIAQGIFKKYYVTWNDLPLSKKRNGGIGSSGTK